MSWNIEILVCKKDTKLLSREKGGANMTYFAFHASKIENVETLVLILKMFKIKFPIKQYTRRYIFDKELFPLEIDDVIIKCLVPHISKTVNFQVMGLSKNLFRIKWLFEWYMIWRVLENFNFLHVFANVSTSHDPIKCLPWRRIFWGHPDHVY